jgi:hypothetical protein
MLMVEVLGGGPEEVEEDEVDEDEDTAEGTDTETETDASTVTGDRAAWDIDEERLHIDAARIYERTIIQLGNRLGDPMQALIVE